MKTKLNSHGFHFVPVIIGLVVLLVIGLVGWRVMGADKIKDDVKSVNDGSSQKATEQESRSDEITWSWSGSSWGASSQPAPDCGEGPEFASPVDVSKVTAVLYPGQTRGGNYKAHGGFLFSDSKQADIDVTIPIDSHLVKASRYIEQGEVQYFMVFTLPCGFAYRFDHLQTLTPEFQSIMDKLPKAEVNNSKTTAIEPAVAVKAGTKVATGVGFKTNTSVDFGVYDLRATNKASRNASYAAQRAQYKEFDFYGVCFLDYLDSSTEGSLRSLPGGDAQSGKSSDYCK